MKTLLEPTTEFNCVLVAPAYEVPCHHVQPYRWISAKGFFDDTPWLRVPLCRQGTVREIPCHPRGGLLGGSSTLGKGKVSKLQALAAARKKKEAERISQSSEGSEHTEAQREDPLRMLEKLAHRRRPSHEAVKDAGPHASREETGVGNGPALQPGGSISTETPAKTSLEVSERAVLKARPSAFANAILGRLPVEASPDRGPPVKSSHGVTYLAPWNTAENTAFLGPSPDDVVTAAQNPKGQ